MSSEPAPSARSASIRYSSAREPQLLEPVRFRDRERLEPQVGESGSPPECQRGPEVARGLPCVAGGEVLATQRKQPLEAIEVQLVGHDLEHVAGRPPRYATVSERLAQPRDVVVERVGGGRWRALSPDAVDQPVARDGGVRVQQQDREERALLGPAQRQVLTVSLDRERPEYREVHERR